MSWGRARVLDPTEELVFSPRLRPLLASQSRDHTHPTCQPFHCSEPVPSSGKVWKFPGLGPQLLDFTSASPSSLLARGHGFPEPGQAQIAFPNPHPG